MRLWLALTLFINSLLAVAFIGHSFYAADELGRTITDQIERDSKSIATSIAAGSANAILSNRLDELEGILLSSAAAGSIQEIVITDSLGRVISQVRRPHDDGGIAPVYDDLGKVIAISDETRENGSHFIVSLPIERGGLLGWVRMTSSLARTSELRSQVRLESIKSGLVAIVFVSLFVTIAIRRFADKLEQLTQFAANLIVSRGRQLKLSSKIRELLRLHRCLNEISTSLDDHIRKLEKSEASKGALLQTSLDAVIAIDGKGMIIDFNPAAEGIFGFRREEVIGQLMSEVIVPPAQREAHERGMRHYLATGEGPVLRKRIEISAIRKGGAEFPVELHISPFKFGGEQYFLGTLRDISERKALEAERERANEALQHSLAEIASRQFALDEHAIVSITDLDGNIVYVNDKFCAISQYGKEELLGRNHRILKSGAHSPAFYGEMWDTICSGKPWHGEIANRRKDGEIYWVAATIMPMLDEHDMPSRYISIRTDITRQKHDEKQLRDSRNQLQESIQRYRATQAELDEARQRELIMGHEIQRTLLFGDLPATAGRMEISASTEPSSGIDGDFYDFFSHGTDGFSIVIGDVMGKGVPAALIGAGVKEGLYRAVADLANRRGHSDERVGAAQLINQLHRDIGPQLISLDTFVTLAYLHFDLVVDRLSLVDAGHTRAIHISGAGLSLISSDNLPLGVIADEQYREITVDISPGDLFFLYSDGLTEAKSAAGEDFGLERLGATVERLHRRGLPVATLVQAVRKAVADFEPTAGPGDDRTCIAIEYSPLVAERPARIVDLPWQLAGLAPLRTEIADVAQQAGLAEEASDALVLAAFETATNIVRHVVSSLPDGSINCRVEELADSVVVSLYYLGPDFDPGEPTPDFSGASEGGFGLYIIRSSVDEVVYDSPAPGVRRVRLRKNKVAARND